MGLSRSTKRAIFFISDFILLQASLYAAFSLRSGTGPPAHYLKESWILFVLLSLAYIPLALAFRIPNIKLGAFEDSAVLRIGLFAVVLSLAAMFLSYMLKLEAPISVPLIFGGAIFGGN